MRKVVSMLLVLVLSIMCMIQGMNVNAKEVKNDLQETGQELIPCIKEMISYMEITNEGDERISLGEKIHVYEYTDSGELTELDKVYIPVLINQKVSFYVIEKAGRVVQIVERLGAEEFDMNGVAIIVEDENSYLWNIENDELVPLYLEEKNSENEIPVTDSLCAESINFSVADNETTILSFKQQRVDNESNYVLNLDTVWQTGDFTCWAACTAAVGNYVTGEDYDDVDIAMSEYGDKYDRDGGTKLVKKLLKNVYGLTYSLNKSGKISDGKIISNLKADYPIITGWRQQANGLIGCEGHMTVIRGINRSQKSIYLMDPSEGRVIVYKDGGEYVYEVYGATLKMYGYVSKK